MKLFIINKRRLWLLLGLMLFSATVVLAEGNVQIDAGNPSYQIQDHGGSSMDPGLGSNVEFFLGSAPAPNVGTGALAPVVTSPRAGVTNFYFTQRGNLAVRVWQGSDHTMGEGNFYGTSSSGHNKLTGADETINLPAPPAAASQYYLNTLRAIYQAMPPYTPTINRDTDITESVVRENYTEVVDMELAIRVNYSEGSPRRQLSRSSAGGTNFTVEVEFPDGTTETRYTNGTLTLAGLTDRRMYRFRARAHNWFGASDWSDWVEWQPLAGSGVAVSSITADFSLVHPADSLGVNMITFPFSSVSDPGAITNAQELIEAVNNIPDKNIVTTLGWWIGSGAVIIFPACSGWRLVRFLSWAGTRFFALIAVLSRDMAYQIYVKENVDLRMIGSR